MTDIRYRYRPNILHYRLFYLPTVILRHYIRVRQYFVDITFRPDATLLERQESNELRLSGFNSMWNFEDLIFENSLY